MDSVFGIQGIRVVSVVMLNNRVIDSDDEGGRLRLKCDGTSAETRFRLSTKRTSSFNP